MKKISLNNNWICKRAGQPEQGMTVNIPHDAMQMDEKDELSAGGVHNGWYVCHDYIYEKAFCASEDWREKRVILEFEGIYKNAIVFLNGERIAVHEYGYTGFYIDISERLCYEKEIPEDLSIVGIDNSDLAGRCEIPLTSAQNPVKELAGVAAAKMLEMLEGIKEEERVELEPELVIRKSVRILTEPEGLRVPSGSNV